MPAAPAAPPAPSAPVAATPPPVVVAPSPASSVLPAVGFLGDLAVIPDVLASLQQDPRTHSLHRDVIAAEVLALMSLLLSLLLVELRRRERI